MRVKWPTRQYFVLRHIAHHDGQFTNHTLSVDLREDRKAIENMVWRLRKEGLLKPPNQGKHLWVSENGCAHITNLEDQARAMPWQLPPADLQLADEPQSHESVQPGFVPGDQDP